MSGVGGGSGMYGGGQSMGYGYQPPGGRPMQAQNYRGTLGGGFSNRQTMPMQGEMSDPYSVQAPQQSLPSYGGEMGGPKMASPSYAAGGTQNPMMSNYANVASFDPSKFLPQQAKVYTPPGPYTPPTYTPPSIPPTSTGPAPGTPPSTGPGPTTGNPQTPGNPNNPPINTPPSGVPALPGGPMQQGQTGWNWDNQRSQFLPQWSPQARQFIINQTHGSGSPAPWMNSSIQNAEYTDPNFMQMIQQKSGQTFGG